MCRSAALHMFTCNSKDRSDAHLLYVFLLGMERKKKTNVLLFLFFLLLCPFRQIPANRTVTLLATQIRENLTDPQIYLTEKLIRSEISRKNDLKRLELTRDDYDR